MLHKESEINFSQFISVTGKKMSKKSQAQFPKQVKKIKALAKW